MTTLTLDVTWDKNQRQVTTNHPNEAAALSYQVGNGGGRWVPQTGGDDEEAVPEVYTMSPAQERTEA